MKTKQLLITLLMCCVSISISAAEWTDANGTVWKFSISETNATITSGISGTIPNNLVIPSTVYVDETAYTVTSIGDYAFINHKSLTSINIPDGVTSIGSNAFNSCYDLISINIPNGVTYIGESSFNQCYNLTSINIPNGVTFIGEGAFNGCSSLTSINIPDGVTDIKGSVFNACSSLTSINIPDGVTFIGSHAFQACSSLTSINIPDGVTFIGNDAFSYCLGIRSLYIKDLKKYLQISFGNTGSVPLVSTDYSVELYINNNVPATTIVIPEGVTNIPSSAFRNCSKLTSIIIPDGVTSIGQGAFYGTGGCYMYCENATPCTIGSDVFSMINTIFVPDEAVEDYRAAWASYSDIIVGNSSDDFVDVTLDALPSSSALRAEFGEDEDEVRSVVKLKVSGTINSYDMMIIRNKMTNLRELDLEDATIVANDYEYYQGCHSEDNVFGESFLSDTKIRSVVLPTTVTSIGGAAFYNCSNLRSVSNMDGIINIGSTAFYNCNALPSIDLPSSLSTIGGGAFANCTSFTSIIIPEGVTTINQSTFSNCINLQSILLAPQTTSIKSYTFNECYQLTEFRLPPYIQSIGDQSFNGCGKLKDIYAYMVDVPAINTNTFNDYQHQILYVPEFLYDKYYYDTNWSQFLEVRVCDLKPGDYTSIYLENSDLWLKPTQRIDQDTPDVEIGESAGVGVEGDTPQHFDEVVQNGDGEGHCGSIIGEGSNIIANKLKLKLQVKANKWVGFNFPYDVTIDECEYPGQHVWIEYDGAARAAGAETGWKVVTGNKLLANKGYMFMSNVQGKLIVTFEHPSFGGDKPQPLQSYASGNAANAGWNFIGNPYSSYYAIDENDFTAPITVWNGTSYEAYRPGDDDYHLQPYQAFFVQMPQQVYIVNFSNERQKTYRQSQQTQQQQAKMRKAQGIQAERLLINLNIGDQETENIDRTRLVLNENASRKYELECDAAKFISDQADAQLYMVENGVQMAINERPTKGDIRMGYKAKKAGTLRIEASRMDLPMMLVDTKTNQTFDLSLGSYEFETEAGTFNSRFMLRPSDEATAIKELTAKTGVAIGTQDGGLSIGGAEGKIISIYTTNGAQVAQQAGNGFVSLSSGLYIVKVGNQSAKIYVK